MRLWRWPEKRKGLKKPNQDMPQHHKTLSQNKPTLNIDSGNPNWSSIRAIHTAKEYCGVPCTHYGLIQRQTCIHGQWVLRIPDWICARARAGRMGFTESPSFMLACFQQSLRIWTQEPYRRRNGRANSSWRCLPLDHLCTSHTPDLAATQDSDRDTGQKKAIVNPWASSSEVILKQQDKGLSINNSNSNSIAGLHPMIKWHYQTGLTGDLSSTWMWTTSPNFVASSNTSSMISCCQPSSVSLCRQEIHNMKQNQNMLAGQHFR